MQSLPDGDAARRDLARRAAGTATGAPAASAACGPPARPRAWRSARRCSPSCSRSPATSSRPGRGRRAARRRRRGHRRELQPRAGGARRCSASCRSVGIRCAGRHRSGCRGRGGRAMTAFAASRPTSSPNSPSCAPPTPPPTADACSRTSTTRACPSSTSSPPRPLRLVQPVNGLDPTTFTSVAAMESRLVGFARRVFHGDGDDEGVVVGSVTSGGTESCMLAVKTARDVWRSARARHARACRASSRPSPCTPPSTRRPTTSGSSSTSCPSIRPTGTSTPAAIEERLADDVALVVAERPVVPVRDARPDRRRAPRSARRAASRCTSTPASAGSRSPFWPDELPAWDLAVPGVTSLSADLHKYGYAPKGVSVLLTRGRDRQRAPVLRHDAAGRATPS